MPAVVKIFILIGIINNSLLEPSIICLVTNVIEVRSHKNHKKKIIGNLVSFETGLD